MSISLFKKIMEIFVHRCDWSDWEHVSYFKDKKDNYEVVSRECKTSGTKEFKRVKVETHQ